MKQALTQQAISIGLVTLLTFAGLAHAQNTGKMMPQSSMGNVRGQGMVTGAGKQFVKNAAIGGMFEIKSSQLALKKSKKPELTQFAQMMVDQHSSMSAELKQVASSKGLTLPVSLDPPHQQVYNKLAKLNGAAFDSAYIAAQKKAHAEAISVFSKGVNNTKDPDINGFASKGLPTIKEHYQMAQNLGKNGSKGMMSGNHKMMPMGNMPASGTTATP